MAQGEPIVAMPLTVRYHECDVQGVVFNARYLEYVDMASAELCAVLFGSHAAMVERGVDIVVAESALRFLAPSRFGDELVVQLTVEHVGNTSTVLAFQIARGDEVVVEGSNRYVWVDTTEYRPHPLPDDARAILLDGRADAHT